MDTPHVGSDRSNWREGAGVGAGVGTAVALALVVGLGPSSVTPFATAAGPMQLLAVAAGLATGAVIGSLIGLWVPSTSET